MRCDMEELITKITTNKLDKRTVVSFALLGGLPDCKRINTKDYLKVVDSTHTDVEATLTYNKYDKPENLIECDNNEPCLNTGGLGVGATTNYIMYKLPYDATKFANGLVIFYVKGFTGSKAVKMEISDDTTFANADSYTVNVTGKGTEYVPVAIDLTKTPTAVEGNGWEATQYGAYITINVADANAVISSIAVFDSIEDFENNDTVQMGCLTTVEGDDAIDAAEATCANPDVKHDVSSPTFERTITGTKITENYLKLNPLNGKGTATKAYELVTQKFTATAGATYAEVVLADAYAEECGFITVDAGCNLLTRYDIPIEVDVDEDHFIVQAQEDGSVKVLMNQNLAGHEVKITYPKAADVKETIADIDNVDEAVKRVKMYVPYTLSNGKKMAKVYGNVLVTSFTDNLGEDEAEFSVTVSIQKAADGHYYHTYEYK